jgi:hypothetical protein
MVVIAAPFAVHVGVEECDVRFGAERNAAVRVARVFGIGGRSQHGEKVAPAPMRACFGGAAGDYR